MKKGNIWVTIVIVLSIAVIAVSTYAAEQSTKSGKPLSKEQLEQLESGDKTIEALEEFQKAVKEASRKRYFACMKAFGHEAFCECLNKNIAIGLDFTGYVLAVTHTKEELGYSARSNDDKQLIDNAIRVRDQCVGVVKGR